MSDSNKKKKIYKLIDEHIRKFKSDDFNVSDDVVNKFRDEMAENAKLVNGNTITWKRKFIKEIKDKMKQYKK